MQKIQGRSLMLAIAIGALAAMTGCNNNPPPPQVIYQQGPQPMQRAQVQPQTTVQAQTYLMNAQDFDLGTVTSLIKANTFNDGAALEKYINSTPGINNVDLDKDGSIDYIGVKETQAPNGGHAFDLVAFPSGSQNNPNAQTTTIASISFTIDASTNQVVVQAGYPQYVMGYNDYYYNYYVPRVSLGQYLFLSWMFSPGRSYYMYHPYGVGLGYGYGGYSRRAYMQPQVLTQTRTTFQTTTRVAPIAKSAPPANYSIKSAEPTRSRLAAPNPSGPGLTGRSDSMRDYQKRDVAQPKPQGTAFGGRPSVTGQPAAPPRAPSSWGSSSGTRPAPAAPPPSRSVAPPSRSWGSSSGSRPSGGGRRK